MNKIIDFTFPIHRLPRSAEVMSEYGIDYLVFPDTKTAILDNKNLVGDTLGKRRLLIADKEKARLKSTIFNFSQLLSSHKPKDKYIDMYGKIFSYKKAIVVPLIYRKVLKIAYVNGYGLRARVSDVEQDIILPAGSENAKYIGLLKYLGGYILYELTNERKKDTWRKI